jgi:hypothetical protein
MTGIEFAAPGLSGDYLNAWLAALGVTVLVDGTSLRWTDDRVPLAVLTPPDGDDLVEAVSTALPSSEDLDRLAIANPGDDRRFPRNVDVQQFAAAAASARTARDFSLAASVTDLVREPRDGKLPHSAFDPPAPRGETLWSRLRACRMELDRRQPPPVAVRGTFNGTAVRADLNGLGFDFRRIPAGSQSGGPHVDPLLECLAFHGLALLPTRGSGGSRAWTRGWMGLPGGGSRFCWPTWSVGLERWGIDALLGALFACEVETWRGLGLDVTGVYEARRFKRTGDMDQTAGFASRTVP